MTFQAPRAYRELFAAGRFDYWGMPYSAMTKPERLVRYGERRRHVLWLEGIEWEPDRSPAAIAAAAEDDDMLPGLVRFAYNGAGDAWCWYLPWQDGAEPPVLLCAHDEDEAEYWAPDFAQAVERLWLRHGAWCDTDPRDEVLADLAAWLDILAPYLPADRVAAHRGLLAGVAAAPFAVADRALAASFAPPPATLRGHNLMPTSYAVKYLGAKVLPRYDESIAFFAQLVAAGHDRFAGKLDETRRNRDAAVVALATPLTPAPPTDDQT